MSDIEQPQGGTPEISLVNRWTKEIELYQKQAGKWETKGKKIERRYKDERNVREEKVSRYNILWSNVQTLLPALYSRNPKPDFQRRFLAADPVGRVTCEVLERATSYVLEKVDFRAIMRQCVTDRLLPGRGTLWLRYVPHWRDASDASNDYVAREGFEVDDDADANESNDVAQDVTADGEPVQELDYEEVDVDYVHWTDFGHTVARTWQEVTAVWRVAYLTRRQLVKRFGPEKGNAVPLDHEPEDLKGQAVTEYQKKARIYEIWDKDTMTAIWISRVHPEPLDVRDDPLGLEGFFPCPRPLLPNGANDSVIPVPDYVMYQDQAGELDELTSRITLLTRAIKAAGVRDASAPGLERLLSEGLENVLVPVDAWAAFAEKGGLVGAVQMLPMADLAQTLLTLYDAREKVKQDLYEITGMSDIVRGASDPNETYGAQQLKANFVSIRLEDIQADVQRFARDAVSLIAEIMANHFSVDTLAEISGYALMTAMEKEVASRIRALGGELPDDLKQPFEEPTWEEVAALLHNTTVRHYRLDIETDSTLKMNQLQEKADRTELLKAVGDFLTAAANADPTLVPLLGQMLMFAVRAFPVGKSLEASLQETVDQLVARAKQAASNPQPNPAQMKAQSDVQIAQGKNQAALQGKLAEIAADERAAAADRQQEAQLAMVERQAQMIAERTQAQLQAHLETVRAANESTLEQQRVAFEGQLQLLLASIKAAAQVESAEIAAGATLTAAQSSAAAQPLLENQ
ncbi:hypothetical protein SAMN05445871_4038 [Paraburkholderia caballeronis]|uniref:Portal protein n=2 Tax=Paraburkholderia caballeronis TaxID=416943 RepID=A0A1H7L152_9BURK|nr:hypothetical protein C7403_102141 [Paraburkholderia caballeronis]PXX03615.1 hypothetical protein C7407_102141 [Paraburkholderia caballeronis]RAK04359.1 hypothetical protein C7409_102141 [Paraburkholderia caballeronis]SED83324.1 hypothetical protein SAMN05445871_4038 [Paraburkholderia caballeronis]SEK92712.1 hypothetical protein SAMN05192542_104141 [Paraburkholderia caballeronis]